MGKVRTGKEKESSGLKLNISLENRLRTAVGKSQQNSKQIKKNANNVLRHFTTEFFKNRVHHNRFFQNRIFRTQTDSQLLKC